MAQASWLMSSSTDLRPPHFFCANSYFGEVSWIRMTDLSKHLKHQGTTMVFQLGISTRSFHFMKELLVTADLPISARKTQNIQEKQNFFSGYVHAQQTFKTSWKNNGFSCGYLHARLSFYSEIGPIWQDFVSCFLIDTKFISKLLYISLMEIDISHSACSTFHDFTTLSFYIK